MNLWVTMAKKSWKSTWGKRRARGYKTYVADKSDGHFTSRNKPRENLEQHLKQLSALSYHADKNKATG